MIKSQEWAKRAALMGLAASAVLFATVYLGGGAAIDSLLAAGTAPSLGAAQSFAVLGGFTVTNTGATTLTGDLGLSPQVVAVTGFPPGTVTGATHIADAVALQAQTDLTAAYNNLAGQAFDVDLSGTNLGGLTLGPGVYRFSQSAQLTGQLTLNGQGNANAVWVFQIGDSLTTASGSSVIITNNGQSCNVFWQVGSSVILGTTTTFVGNIVALSRITLNNGASVSGRALTRTGTVTLNTNSVVIPVCGAGAAPPPTATATPLPPTATATPLPPTATATPLPPTATATPLPPTATPPPTATSLPPATATPVPPAATATAIALTATAVATLTPLPPDTATPVPPAGLPSTGDPYSVALAWFVLGGAGVAMVGFLMRRRSR